MLSEVLPNIRPEILVGVFALIAVKIIIEIVKYARSNFPPGPIGLPIVGYMPFLSKYAHLDFIKLSKKYGEVFSVRLGSELVVVLNSTKSIREAFMTNDCLGRPKNSALAIFGDLSPFFASNQHIWQEQRRFIVQTMKDLGLGKSKIEVDVQDEINHFLEKLKTYQGKPVDLKIDLSPSTSNNICALVFGRRFEYEHPDRIFLDSYVEEVSKAVTQTASHIFIPWIRKLPFMIKLLKYDVAVNYYQTMVKFFQKKIKEHKETLDPKDVRDFIDSFLIETKSRQAKDPNTTFTETTLVGNVADLFGAGSETVRTSILWFVYVLAAFPEVQKKVLKEIKDVIGLERSPELLDLKDMPYTHSVILEMMRWQTIVPINVLRSTLYETTIGGYTIPKDTIVTANFWAVHHDPKNWEDPDTFKPERFLSPEGKIVKPSSYMPFSLGKRACPGETMAYMEIFLYGVSLLQKFDIAFPEVFKPTFDAELSVTYRLKSYKVRFLLRNK